MGTSAATNLPFASFYSFGVLMLCFLTCCVSSQELYVSPFSIGDRNCTGNGCGELDCPCLDLQSVFEEARALNHSKQIPVDILLFPGIYTGPNNTNLIADFSVRLLSIQGAINTTISSNGIETGNLFISVSFSRSVLLDGITFSNFSSSSTNILSVFLNGTGSITNCIIQNNTGPLFRGVIDTMLSITNTSITHNQSPNSPLISVSSSSVKLDHCSFTNNYVTQILSGSEMISIHMLGCSVTDNNVAKVGFNWAKSAGFATTASLINCFFAHNDIQSNMISVKNTILTASGCSFFNSTNSAASFQAVDSTIVAYDFIFLNNTGSSIIDMDIQCNVPQAVVLDHFSIQGSNSAFFNSNTASTYMSGCNMIFSDVRFSDCFNRNISSGNVLHIYANSPSSHSTTLHQVTIERCGSLLSTYDLVRIETDHYLNISLTEVSFVNCLTASAHYSLNIKSSEQGQLFSVLLDTVWFENNTNSLFLGVPSSIHNTTFSGGPNSSQFPIFIASGMNGTTEIQNSNFYNHPSTALFCTLSVLHIHNSTFYDNIGRIGGAMNVAYSKIAFTDSIFSNNLCRSDGGAIISVESQMNISGCLFQNNSAPFHNGGALSLATLTELSISNSSFLGNAAGTGGAISLSDYSHMNMSDCIMNGNRALQEGGAIFIENDRSDELITRISDCHIIHNECVHGVGGGIVTHFLATPQIIRCNISHNSANSGGGLAFTDGSSPYLLENTIDSNFASSSGGGIMVQGFSSPFLSNCTITNNYVNSTGGGIVIKDISNPIVLETIIRFNSSPNEGGGIVCTDKSFSIFTNCTMSDNESGGSGGALAFGITASGNITNCHIQRNVALSSGGGLSLHNQCSPNFFNIEMTNNTASEGGAISIEDTGSPTFISSSFNENMALSHGGSITSADFSLGEFYNCTFLANRANSGKGGVLKLDDFAICHFEDCILESNHADSGGAVYTSSRQGPVFIRSEFNGNHARLHGGAFVFAATSGGLIDTCIFDGNSADEHGGAVLFQDEAAPRLFGTNFTRNQVILSSNGFGEGGAFSVWDNASPIISSSYMSLNSGFSGGAVSIHVTANMTLENSVFYNNSATNGGAIFYRGFRSEMVNITFEENCGQFGGGLYLDSSFSEPNYHLCKDCYFYRNHAKISGGGLYVKTLVDLSGSGDPLLPTPLSTSSTSVDLDGSGDPLLPTPLSTSSTSVDTNRTRSFSFVSPLFRENTALRGGAIFYSGIASLVNFGPSCLFVNNSATEFGGGLFINHISLDFDDIAFIQNGTFTGNDATYAGTNVAWNYISSVSTAGDFCQNCSYGDPSPSFHGYQTELGWATVPDELQFNDGGCPSSLYVTASPFSISTILLDYFGTPVVGEIDTSNNVTISAAYYGNCKLITNDYHQEVNANTAVAIFSNLTIEGKNKQSCQLIFSVPYMRNVFIPPIACNVSLYGCPSGQEVSSEEIYDVCIPDSGDTSRLLLQGHISLFLSIIVLLLLCIICGVFTCAFIKYFKKRYRRYVLLSTMIPDLQRKPTVTLEGILSDPKIPHVPWDELFIKERIGIGANGIVSKGLWKPVDVKDFLKKHKHFPARSLGLGVEIAVKELLVEQMELLNPITLEEFLIEIKFLSKLNHANVVRFLGISSPATITTLYLVTELMHFGSLRDVLDRNQTIPWDTRLKLAKDAAKGMAYLHKRKIIHRDLKSQNLLVDKTWTCKVADFGISTVKEAKTRTMTCIGTPLYMAPEVLGKEKYSEKADVFSFGILLVEIYTGKVPYTSKRYAKLNQAQLMHEICNENARPNVENIPEALRELINDCWNLNPKLRPSFSEIVVRLRRLKHLNLAYDFESEMEGFSANDARNISRPDEGFLTDWGDAYSDSEISDSREPALTLTMKLENNISKLRAPRHSSTGNISAAYSSIQ